MSGQMEGRQEGREVDRMGKKRGRQVRREVMRKEGKQKGWREGGRQHYAHISDAKPSLWRRQQVLVTTLDQPPGLGIWDYYTVLIQVIRNVL